MNKVRLGDVATYINGYAFKPDDRGSVGLPIIRIQDLTGNSYDLGFYDGEYPKRIEINNGDVLISWSASLGVYVWNKGKALLNQHIFKVVFDKLEIDKQFFVYAVEHNLKEMVKQTHGATMKHIIKKDFDNTFIPYPSLEHQKRIAKLLDKTCDLIEKMKTQSALMEELIKARFVEMFGDFESLVNIWEPKKISDVTINYDNTRKPIKDSDRKKIQGKYPYYGATGIVDYLNNYRIDGTFLLVSEDGKALEFRNRDIAFIAKGKIWVNNHAHVLQCNSLVNMIFLMYYINNRDISSWVTGIDQKKLNRENLDKMPVGVPPIELQNRFADFVAQIEKQKTTVKMSLEKLETLKKSLMQEYFG